MTNYFYTLAVTRLITFIFLSFEKETFDNDDEDFF